MFLLKYACRKMVLALERDTWEGVYNWFGSGFKSLNMFFMWISPVLKTLYVKIKSKKVVYFQGEILRGFI